MRSLLFSALVTCFLGTPLRAADVLVFAAASLAGPLDTVAAAFEDATGHTVTVSYGASSTLARQVAAGAPADVVLLANESWMDHLSERAAIEADTRLMYLSNQLALIGHTPALLDIEGLPDAIGQDRLALALTEAVPAGIYAREALETLGIYDSLRPNIVETDNVRAALQLVALGAAHYGIVYASDVSIDERVRFLALLDRDLHQPIGYPLALTTNAQPEAAEFHAFLQTVSSYMTFFGANFMLPNP